MTKGRKALTHVAAEVIDPALDQVKIEGAALALREADARVRAVAAKLGYQLPADAADADLIQRDIAANMRRSVEACLEVGRGLCVLKEVCAHGEFLGRIEALNIEARVAQRFMLAAAKFSNAVLTPHLARAIGNQTKLFELLVLEDEQVEELSLLGQTGELSLDDVASMSVKELRKAVRELRADREADQSLIEKKNQKIDKLTRDVRRISTEGPDAVLEGTLKEAGTILADALGAIRGNVRKALLTIAELHDPCGSQEVYMAGMVGQLQAELNALREEFQLPDVSSAAAQQLASEVAQWWDGAGQKAANA